jgi:large conductance mechanosensitive channel
MRAGEWRPGKAKDSDRPGGDKRCFTSAIRCAMPVDQELRSIPEENRLGPRPEKPMTLIDEFKKFIARGSVLDLAVGVMIGAAFGKIVTSLTESVIMPVIGWIFGNIDFSRYFILLGEVPAGYSGDPRDYAALKAAGVPIIGYGDFLTQLVNFLIIAIVLFMLVRSVNRVMDAMEEEKKNTADTSAEPSVPTDPQLDALNAILAELRRRPEV